MANKDEPTLYDRETKRFKNKPWVVKLIASSILVAGLATLITNIQTIRDAFAPTASSAPKVRVQYYTVGGHAISFLLLGLLDPALQKHLGGKPTVWQNKVYDEARNLHNSFATTVTNDNSLQSADFEPAQLAALSRSAKVMQFTTQRSIEIEEDTLLNDPKLGNPLTEPAWRVAWIKNRPRSEIIDDLHDGSISIDSLVFSKRLTCKDAIESFERIGVSGSSFLKYVGSQGCAGLTFDVVAHYHGEGCVSEGWDARIYVPGLSLQLAVVQNISDKAVRIERLEFKATTIKGIGLADGTSPVVVSKGTLGDGTLLPNDRLIIPLSLRFSTEFKNSDFIEPDETYEEADLGSDSVRALATGHSNIELVVSRTGASEPTEETESVNVPAPDQFPIDLQPSSSAATAASSASVASVAVIGSLPGGQLLRRYGFTPNDTKGEMPFIGTILSPTKMIVDGLAEEVHKIELGGMYISDTLEGGSCPYLFAKSKEGPLLEPRKILVHRDSTAKRGMDSRYVSDWPTTVVVEERDPETTYLHSVSLLCETPSGTVISREPALTTSPFRRGPAVLKRGQSQAIEFEALNPAVQCESVFINVEGYYIPDSGLQPTKNLSLVNPKD
jgi:hypothetical protein